MDLMTIGEMSEVLARVERVHSPGYIARQLRGFVQRGALVPATYKGEGRTAAAVFDFHGLCAARLLTVLSRLGLSIDQLVVISRCFRNMRQDFREWMAEHTEGSYSPGIPVANEMAALDKPVFFVAQLASYSEHPDVDDSLALGGAFTLSPDFVSPQVPFLAAIVLDCRHLFRLLYEAATGDA